MSSYFQHDYHNGHAVIYVDGSYVELVFVDRHGDVSELHCTMDGTARLARLWSCAAQPMIRTNSALAHFLNGSLALSISASGSRPRADHDFLARPTQPRKAHVRRRSAGAYGLFDGALTGVRVRNSPFTDLSSSRTSGRRVSRDPGRLRIGYVHIVVRVHVPIPAGLTRRQVFDLPEIAVRVIEHQVVARHCDCATVTHGVARSGWTRRCPTARGSPRSSSTSTLRDATMTACHRGRPGSSRGSLWRRGTTADPSSMEHNGASRLRLSVERWGGPCPDEE